MKYYPRWQPGSPCPNNEAILCPDVTKCNKCGWNPEVIEKRMKERKPKQKRRYNANG